MNFSGATAIKQKVLIAAYNFPPCSLTSANRAWAWAEYLYNFGYYPVIVTRNWDIPLRKHDDETVPSGKKIIHKKYSSYEIYYLPYKGSIRDKLRVKHEGKLWFGFLSKGYTLFEIFLRNYWDLFIPYRNFYRFADRLLNENKDIKKMIVTVRPFHLFKFAYKLHNKYRIKWIADYRDDWNTSEFSRHLGSIEKFLTRITIKKEKLWVGSSNFITSISDSYVDKIEKFLGKPGCGLTLANGFFEEELAEYRDLKLYREFTIVYNGTLYADQDINVFLEAIARVTGRYPRYPVKIKFPGIGTAPEIMAELKSLTAKFGYNVEMTDRIDKKKALKMQARSHLMLMVAHRGINNVPSSKIYEYIGLKKKVLVCPTDHGVIEKTLTEAGNGLFAADPEQAANLIEKELLSVYSGNYQAPEMPDISKYTREVQTKKMAGLLDKL